GQARPAGMDADPKPDVGAVRPASRGDAPLDPQSRIDGPRGSPEDGEHLVGTHVHLFAPRALDGATEQTADIVQQAGGCVARAAKAGGVRDGGEEQGDLTGGKPARDAGPRARFAFLALRQELAGDEPDRQDSILLGCCQESLARVLASRLVFELRLAEASQRVT